MNITIPDHVLAETKLSAGELILDFAIYLYDKKIVSIGQAKKIAGLNLLAFQQELAKRSLFIHYEIEDLEKDLENLKSL